MLYLSAAESNVRFIGIVASAWFLPVGVVSVQTFEDSNESFDS